VSRHTRIALVFAGAVLLFIAVRAVVAFGRFSRVEKQFATVQNWASRASVVTKMGMPNYYAAHAEWYMVPTRAAPLSMFILIRSHRLFPNTTSCLSLQTTAWLRRPVGFAVEPCFSVGTVVNARWHRAHPHPL